MSYSRRRRSSGRKILFRFFLISGGIFLVLLTAAVLIPVFFKDEINIRVKKEVNKRLNAVADYNDFDLSLLSQFPYLSIQLEGFSLRNKEPFAGDTLISLKELEVAVNLMNVIKGEQMEVKKIILDRPKIHAKVRADGKANWDIVIPDSTPASAPDTAKSAFNLKLSKLQIKEANVIYDDKYKKMYASVRDFNFTGSGDFTADLFELATRTQIAAVDFQMNGSRYISKMAFESKADLEIDNKNKKYAFKENTFKFNDLQLALDGFVQVLNDSSYRTDVKFKALETSFKEVLSLVPGMYTEQFQNIKTEGTFSLNGDAKGVYSSTTIPAFNVNLNVKDGFFQYPDLPAPVRNIQVDLHAYNQTDQLNNTNLNIKRFHCNLENNPIDAKVLISGLKEQVLDGFVKAKVDLSQITRMFPIEKLELKGQLTADATFKGQVTSETLPALKANFDLKYGYVKYKDFPSALQNLTLTARADCPTGHKSDLIAEVTNFHTEIDNEPVDAKLLVKNLDSPEYELKLKGSLDLGKITQIYPLKDAKLSGKIKADVDTKGSMQKIENKEYADLPTTGFIECSNVEYTSKDITQRITVRDARLEFTPDYLNLASYNGTAGSSDLALKGRIDNYLGYLFKNQEIKGKLNLTSAKLNLNEWMTDNQSPPPPKGQEKPLEPFPVPEKVDFVFSAALGEVLYDKWNIANLRGDVTVREQAVRMENLVFRMLGARFRMNGLYNAKDLSKPAYEFDLKIDTLKFNETYKAFDAVKKLAPIAEKTEGGFVTAFSINGLLDGTMMPVYSTMNAQGRVDLIRAVLKGVPILEKIADLTKLNNYRELRFAGTSFDFQILNGRLYIDPFDIKRGQHVMTVSGSTGIDQSIDYKINLDVPAPAVAGQAASALSKLVNRSIEEPERLNVKLRVGGTYPQPAVTGGSIGADGTSITDGVKTKIKDEINTKKEELKSEIDRKKREAEDRIRQEAENKKRELEDKARTEAERIKQEAENKKRELEEKARREADEKKRQAEQKAKEEADRLKKEAEQKLKDKFKLPR